MSGREQIYAEHSTVARVSGELVVGDDVAEAIGGLIRAHQGYDSAEHTNEDELRRLRAEIQELTDQKTALETERQQETHRQGDLRHKYSGRIESLLKDPDSKIHPIYRATLMAPRMDQGSLWYPGTFAMADELGRNLVEFDEHLKSVPEPAPALGLRYIDDSMSDNFSRMHINFGYTLPKAGFEAHVSDHIVGACSCGAEHHEQKPFLRLPIVEASLGAAHATGRRYKTSSGHQVLVDQDRTRTDSVITFEPDIPIAEAPIIPLPTGNLYNERYTLAMYDKEGDIAELEGPRKFLGRGHTLCAVGEQAVKKTLLEMHKRSLEAGQLPEMFKDMSIFVASSIGVAIKSREFATKKSLRTAA